jgi:WhiB family transcriptional regulator, redox-sensing transcriptional regulator
MSWRQEAACRDKDPSTWFPAQNERVVARGSYAVAKRICRECPVRQECLDEALRCERGLAVTLRSGMWGGLLPSERVSLEKVLRQGGNVVLTVGRR